MEHIALNTVNESSVSAVVTVPFHWEGGNTALALSADTWGTSDVTLNYQLPNGQFIAYVNLPPNNAVTVQVLPPGNYQIVVGDTGASGISLIFKKIPQ